MKRIQYAIKPLNSQEDAQKVLSLELDNNLFEYLKAEWGLWNRFLGKVLLFVGPKSSGKSILMKEVLHIKSMNFETIDRKTIIQESYYLLGQKYFTDLFARTEELVDRKISHLDDLIFLNPKQYDESRILKKILDQANARLEQKDVYINHYLTLYSRYFQIIKAYINSGINVVLDENLFHYPEQYSIFQYAFGGYSQIRVALIYNNLAGLVAKLKLRNDKFISLLQSTENPGELHNEILQRQLKENDSGFIFRDPAKILADYQKIFSFNLYHKHSSRALERLTGVDLHSVIAYISQLQKDYQNNKALISYLGYDLKSVSVENEVSRIFGNNIDNSQIIYVTSKNIEFDFLIQFSEMLPLDDFSRERCLKVVLRDIIDWCSHEEGVEIVLTLEDHQRNDQDFIRVEEVSHDKMQYINSVVHKAAIGFKVADSAVDSLRLVYEPTFANTKIVIIDFSYIYSMYHGVNAGSVIVNALATSYQLYHGDYQNAFVQFAISASYMIMPFIMNSLALPHLVLAYGLTMTIYSAYITASNVHSLYKDLCQDKSEQALLRSLIAYKDLAEIMSESPLQAIYDFKVMMDFYQMQINNIETDNDFYPHYYNQVVGDHHNMFS